jgi:hypothetical protein
MRSIAILVAGLVLTAPFSAEAAVSSSVQAQIDALLREIAKLQAKVDALEDDDSHERPHIDGTSAKAAGDFEMDAGGSAKIIGENLMGTSIAKTKVSIGGKKARIESGNDSALAISVPAKLKAGKSYKLYVQHKDGKSNTVRVEILSVLGHEDDVDEDEDAFLRIKNPLDGHEWRMGDTQEFRWSTDNVSKSVYGYIELTDRRGIEYRIKDVKNTGEYEWTVGDMKGGMDAGDYEVRIVMGGVSANERWLTISDGTSEAATIKTEWSLTGFDGDYKIYKVELSGGTDNDPVYKLSIDVTCPSNISEAVAKVWGDTCGADGLVIYGNDDRGDTTVTFRVIHDAPYDEANLILLIKAIGYDGASLGKTQLSIPVHKG